MQYDLRNNFSAHITANVSPAPFVSANVDIPCLCDFAYMFRTPSTKTMTFHDQVVGVKDGHVAVVNNVFDPTTVWVGWWCAFDARGTPWL